MKVAQNVSLTFATSLASSGCTALAGLIIATTLGARGAGTFALARAVPALATLLLGLGIPVAITYFVGGRRMPIQAVCDASLSVGLAVSAAGAGAWLIGSRVLQAHFFTAIPLPGVMVLAGVIPMALIRNQLNAILQGLQRFRAANAALLLEDLVGLLAVLPLLRLPDEGPALIVAAAVAGPGASRLAWGGRVRRAGVRLRPRFDRARCDALIRFGLKGHVGRMANQLNWRLDLIMLSTMSSLEMVGYYSVATKVAEVLRPLAGSLNFVLRPLMSSLPAEEAIARSIALYRRIFLVNGLTLVALSLGCGTIIPRLFGPAFVPAVPACQVLLLGLVLQGGDGILNGYNVGIGRPEFNTYAALGGLVITVVGNPALIPAYGLMGAAVTSAVAYTARSLVMVALFLRSAGLGMRDLAGVTSGPESARSIPATALSGGSSSDP